MSSKACRTVLLPEPESPVRMTSLPGFASRLAASRGDAAQLFSGVGECWDFSVFAILCDRAAGHVNSRVIQLLGICSSVSGCAASSSSIIFLHDPAGVSSDIPPPSGPFTDSLKNERSSSTPLRGVRVLAGHRAAHRQVALRPLPPLLIIMGFSASWP